jgi:type VI secretion system ImpA/VasJ family protein
MLEELDSLASELQGAVAERPTPVIETARHVPETPGAPVQPAAAASSAAPRTPAVEVPRVGGDALATLLGLCGELRRRNPDEALGYALPRFLRWRDLPEAAAEPVELLAPTPMDRAQLAELFAGERWKPLLEASEALAESPVGAGWLDLQRFACVAMFELGEQYVQPRRAVVRELRACLAARPWLAEAKLADGSPAADETTRGWLAAEITQPANGVIVPKPRAGDAVVAPDETALTRARELFQRQGLEPAAAHVRAELEKARSGRERARLSQALGELCLEAKRPELAVPILEGVRRTLEQNDLGGWEGPAFVNRNLTALFRGYSAWDSTPPEDVGIRRQRLAEEIARVDLGLRLQLEAQRS